MGQLAARMSSPRQPLVGMRWLLATIATVTIAIAYFAAARISLHLLESSGVAVFWPAAGVASGVLIAIGPVARWPVLLGVSLGTVAANLLGDRNLSSSIVFAVANAGEAVFIAMLLERFFGPRFELNALRRVLGFFAATAAGTAVSGIVGTLGFVLFHSPRATAPSIWLNWVVSDSLGTITVAPLAIALAAMVRERPASREIVEGFFALSILCSLSAFLVFLPNQPWTIELAIASLGPLFVWIAARLRPAFTAVATFISAITILWTTIFSIGLFGDPRLPTDERILSAQASILAISFGALVLAALFSERRLHEAAIVDREARLQDALQAGGVIAFDWDIAADEMRHSQNATRILGSESKPVLSGAEWLRNIHSEDRAYVMACMLGVRPGTPSHSVTFRYMRPNGDPVWLEQIGITKFDSAGKPTRMDGLRTDVTERKRFEEEVSLARKSAEVANRAKSSFLAAASHDLRQPLQTLQFLREALERNNPDGEVHELITGMGRSLDTMSSTLSVLLDINRLETGTLQPSRTDFPAGVVLNSVASDFLHLIEEKGLRLRVVRSDLLIRSDRRMLEEMIRNLLSNAVRYTDRGKILLGCRRKGNKALLEVWDSGVGVADKHLPRIFEEYYQGPGGMERGGFGLGLAIVKRLAEMLDHSVEVRSTPGKGTRISIAIPRGETSAPATSAHQADYDGNTFRGTLLVIEDETSVRSAINRLLKVSGIRAVVVGAASDALSLIDHENLRPDFVLCDYNLRGSTNGVESIRILRQALGWNVPAIVMTGDTRADTMEAIVSHNIAVLTKPFLARELLQLMDGSSSGG